MPPSDNNLLNAAIRYAELGWHIFPCVPGDKKPLNPNGCRGASADVAQIRAWWAKWPNANIGLACGKVSGVSVVDIDVDEEKGKNGWATLGNYPAMPTTVIAESPRGGAHYVFATDDPPANKNEFAHGVDIRGDGYYIVLAPSIHPNGKAYRWREGCSPWDLKPAPYPDFMRPKKAAPVPWLPSAQTATARPAPSASATPIEERARLYLQECQPAVQGSAGHDSLLWAARAMVKGFLLPESVALAMLESHFNPRCAPPWDLGNPTEAKDFARKVQEAARTPARKPDGWLLDEYNLRHNGDDALLRFGDRLAESLLESLATGKTPITTKIPDTAREEIESTLLEPPGLVGEVCRWINGTAIKAQPLLTLGAALTFCGAIMGRKMRDEWDNRTNLYTMSVAPSSAGKNHARKQIKRLITAANIGDLLGGEDVTSDAAIEKRLEEQPTTLFLWDEIGHMMQSIRAAGTNPHLGKVLPTLMKLYSAAGETYVGKEYSTQERKQIEQPCCCLYGTTTPDKLADGITPDEIKDGFLGRVLVFVSMSNPKKNFERAKGAVDIPSELITKVQSWWQNAPRAQSEENDIANAMAVHTYEVPTSDDAHRRFLEFEDLAEMQAERSDTKLKGIDRLWGKAGENARKIALIVACGDNIDEPVIELSHAEYACKLVSYQIARLADLVAENVGESRIEKDKQFLLRVIKEAGKKGLPKRELTRRTQRFEARQRETYLRDLIEAEEIVIVPEGKTARIYQYPYGLPSHESA